MAISHSSQLWLNNNKCSWATANLFTQMHQNKHFHHSYLFNIIAIFFQIRSVASKYRTHKNRVWRGTPEIVTFEHVARKPTLNTRKLSHAAGFPRTTVLRIFECSNSNRIKYGQQLEYCNTITQTIINNSTIFFKNMFYNSLWRAYKQATTTKCVSGHL